MDRAGVFFTFGQTYARSEDEFGNSSLIADLKEERRQHDRLFRMVRPRTWYLGHYHQRAEKQNAGCRTRILDCGELIRHTPACAQPIPVST